MRSFTAVISVPVACLFLAGPIATSAAEGAKPLTPQQQRMKDCNKEAAEKKLTGAERKSFMKECLSTKKSHAPQPAPAAPKQGK
jgi:hypothetical protein